MDFDDTPGPDSVADPLGAALRAGQGPEGPGLQTQAQQAMIAAALFDEPITPIKIGRFTIVRELGAGGMGVVYVAYDEQLDRRVAVKLLRGAATDTQAKARLEREAQAMARLSHPNVVTVHEVGTYQGQVFVAMEFVEGSDLRAWLGAQDRRWPEIVAVFRQAGEGLAAAHQAGIVHRDFKPDNVLVGADGRVRVADFGLAHALDASAEAPTKPSSLSAEAQRSAESSSGRLDRSLTRTGALMGTPAYMAPEQYTGRRTDAHSDQFGFCVALWEGLYARRPFSGPTLAALATAITEAKIDEPPETSEVPSWLRAALIRGMSPAPHDRWPSMRALIDLLGDDPQRRRRRRLELGALTSVAALLVTSLAYVAASQLRENARRRYWSALTEQLLEIERVRGFRQATDDARRARDATRMSVYRSYRPRRAINDDHEDPTVAAALLREVEGEARASEAWISAANEVLGQPLSHAVLDGHRDVVTALVFAPNEAVLYSAASDGEVWRWDIETGIGRPIIVHDDNKEVTALALSPDGHTVVSASRDRTARSWSAARGVQLEATHASELTDVGFAPDGQRIVTASRDASAIIHALDSNASTPLRGHSGQVHAAEFDGTGARVLTASGDKSARLWRADDGELLEIFAGHQAPVFHARFVGRDAVLTGSDDGSVRVWRLQRDALVRVELLGQLPEAITALEVHGRQLAVAALDGSVAVAAIDEPSSWRILENHAKPVWALVFRPDGGGLVSASFDQNVRLHDLHDRSPPRTFTGHRLALLSAAIDPTGRWLATGAWDGQIRLWDLTRPTLQISLAGHAGRVNAVDFDRAGQRVITSSLDGTARLWSAATGRLLSTFDCGDDVTAAAFSPTRSLVATATSAGAVDLWDPQTHARVELRGHERSVWQIDFDDAGERLGSASSDMSARVWDLAGEPLLLLQGHQARVTAIDLGAPDQPIATTSHDGTLRLWDFHDGRELAVLRGHQGWISALARSPTGLLATASDDGTARLWPDANSANAIILAGHTKQIWDIAFDHGGGRVATASLDGTVRVWATHDGSLLATLAGHSEDVYGVRFVGAEQLVTVSHDRSLRVWSLTDGRPPIVLTAHDDAITTLALSPDQRQLVTASADQSAKIWRLDRLSNNPEQLALALAEVTSFCLPVEQRVRELGEAATEAMAAFTACEAGPD